MAATINNAENQEKLDKLANTERSDKVRSSHQSETSKSQHWYLYQFFWLLSYNFRWRTILFRAPEHITWRTRARFKICRTTYFFILFYFFCVCNQFPSMEVVAPGWEKGKPVIERPSDWIPWLIQYLGVPRPASTLICPTLNPWARSIFSTQVP